ncbi:hypothetical protein QUF58_00415 [Anaerolineales bacterium HSG24]|nr:hypothetical protein [Anaerolineales bacterium HSG24]
MARQLVFQTDQKYPFSITKLDRAKLYGRKETVAFDPTGQECVRMDIDTSGSFIIPKGGKALGILDEWGHWINRKELKAVYKDGAPAQRIPSSFDAPIELDKTVTVEYFLDHCITSVYMLQSAPASDADTEAEAESETVGESLIEQVKQSDKIYSFTFNYRAGYEGMAAFLIEKNDSLFMLVGYPIKFEFIGLEQIAEFNAEEDEEEEFDDDLDFSMM